MYLCIAMRAINTIITTIITVCLLCACHGEQAQGNPEGDTIPLRYARNITLVQHRDYVEAILRNPWDTTKTLNRYEIREPLRKAAVFTAVHCALLQELGVERNIGGVCDLSYINMPYIQHGVQQGTIKDLGNGIEPNIERVIDLMPDALMPSPFEHSGGYGRLERLDIPIIECADYMENGPLARAEWMKFYGRLFGCGERADSLFATVEQAYLALKAIAEKAEKRPTLIVDKPYQGTWHVPGGQSTTGILYRDAGAEYLFADRPECGGVPMSFEAVMEKGQKADFWLLKYTSDTPLTLSELADDTPLYTHFDAFKNHRVYGCNTTTSGFFEETPFHPERLLANLIGILHPELDVDVPYIYYHLLNEK